MSYYNTPEGKDPGLWKIAKKRASFKYHLGTFIVINIFFWVLWYFTGQHTTKNGWPWPVWPVFGWGIGLLFHFLGVYVDPGSNGIEREYEKLELNRNKQL
ncbi:MAG TPA: 2TM domain-containing protein [Chitinophagaceae bacterium]|nr:2TM domain-containing protein [Chitinophagaceae bacterium]